MDTRSPVLARASGVRLSSRLEEDILRVLLYFDIFRYPLTAEEIYRFLPSDSTSPPEIIRACTAKPLRSMLDHQHGHFFLAESNGSQRFLASRIQNERRARKYIAIARFFTRMIRQFPFVRAVFVSGELSKGVATPQGDIDYFIITAEHRLWIARTMLIIFKKIVLLNNKKFFCLNHFITQEYLDVDERNLYSALEIATLKPLHNLGLFAAYLERNAWIRHFFPNLVQERLPDRDANVSSRLQRILEIPLRGPLGDRLDLWLMEFWRRIWERRYSDLPKQKRDALFRCERSISTAYAGDFLSKVLNEYQTRLQRFGLDAGSFGE